MAMSPIYLFYHYSHSFGDTLSAEIVAKIIGTKDFPSVNGWVDDSKSHTRIFQRHAKPEPLPDTRLLALGSIFHNIKQGDVVWGTGINPKWQSLHTPCVQPDIRAVRGPLTRNFLQRRYGWEVPEIYGDPAILMPELFPELKPKPLKDYTVILQHNDEEYAREIQKSDNNNIFYCQRPHRKPWREVIDNILAARLVISSSLHAIIIAEMFGIPARWLANPELPSTETEAVFKFNDYYMSSGREPYQLSLSVEQALNHGGTEKPSGLNKKLLLEAFPRELFA